MTQKRTVWDLSDAELEVLARQNSSQTQLVRSVLRQSMTGLTNAVERLESSFSDFTQRGAALLTVASLFTLLPIATGNLHYMLLWVFPFLLAGIFTFIASSKRPNVHKVVFTVAAEGEEEELVILRNETNAIQHVWDVYSFYYSKILNYYRATTTFIMMYFLSYAINYYYLEFVGTPSLKVSIVILIIVAVVGLRRFWENIRDSHQVGNLATNYRGGIGGAPADI